AYSRVRIAAFRQIAAKVATKGPCLLLVDETGSDQQLSYIINPPDYQAPALICRLPQSLAEQQQLAAAFPDRLLYTVQVQLPDLQIRPWVVPANP
ncbi:MAG: hypothetical protein ACK5DR_15005, partial [Planctomyces sp.]